jgi:hypothetical protein
MFEATSECKSIALRCISRFMEMKMAKRWYERFVKLHNNVNVQHAISKKGRILIYPH